jgi:hypothetical protein
MASPNDEALEAATLPEDGEKPIRTMLRATAPTRGKTTRVRARKIVRPARPEDFNFGS